MNATHAGFTREFEQGAVRGSLVCNRWANPGRPI